MLATSGHVAKFADWTTKDPKTGEIFRADHLVEEVLESRLKGDATARGQAVTTEGEADPKKKKKIKTAAAAVKLDDTVKQEMEGILARIDNYDGPGLGEIMVKYDIRNPTTGGPLEAPVAYNLVRLLCS